MTTIVTILAFAVVACWLFVLALAAGMWLGWVVWRAAVAVKAGARRMVGALLRPPGGARQ